MQCVEIDPREGTLMLANAGVPYPVLYSARRGKCDRLIVHGSYLFDGLGEGSRPPSLEQRRAEFSPGDALVLLTDGLTENHRLDERRYGYRFAPLVEKGGNRSAKEIGEAILADWTAHPRDERYHDDISLMVLVAPRA